MSNPPLVSVVVPTYNQPCLLMETLDSVAAQTYTDYEVVVVDDGSTDDTVARLRERALRDKRLRVVTQANAGVGPARNRGIDEARGRYVALLDHDDLWMPGKLAVQTAFLEARPECVAAGVPFALSTAPSQPAFDPATAADAFGVVHRPLHKAQHLMLLVTCSTLMFRRERAVGCRFGTERGITEDVPFYIRLFALGEYGLASSDVLVVYRLHGHNTSRQASYHYGGIRSLRRLDRCGAFATAGPPVVGSGGEERRRVWRSDLDAYLGHLARVTAIIQLSAGWRRRGALVWLTEFIPQLRLGRVKFLVTFPLLLLLPVSLIRRRWPAEVS